MTVATAAGYTIREAAGRTGLSQDTVRYYERIGLVPPVGRDRSGCGCWRLISRRSRRSGVRCAATCA
jgi:hypothetical protein